MILLIYKIDTFSFIICLYPTAVMSDNINRKSKNIEKDETNA